MKQEIRLFIEGREVEFSEPPAILFTYTENDLTNPTIIKNHYTKTITIEGTPNNNDIFGHIWDLSRVTNYYAGESTRTGYNATKKAHFELIVNGEIYESGYVKLNKVNKEKRATSFEITMYGGIGDAFYILSYDADGNKLKLSDLTYLPDKEEWNGMTLSYPAGDEHEFDMVIDKYTLARAWNCINWEPDYDVGEPDSTRHFKYINFAPCYNGLPDFDTDKVLINFNNAALFSGVTDSAQTEYKSYGGYGIGHLPEKLDEWAVRDLRSYLQRPVLRIKGLIGGIKRFLEDNGYELDLSPSFFSSQNPYFERTWMALPLLTELKLQGTDTSSGATSTHTWENGKQITINGHQNTTYMIDFTPDFPLAAGHIDVEIDFGASAYTYIEQNMFSSCWIGNSRNFSAYAVQLVAFAGEDWNSDKVAASNTAWLTSKVGEDFLQPSETFYQPVSFNTDITPVFGYFKPVGDNKYEWSEKFTLSMDIPTNARAYGLMITAVANLEKWERWKKNFWGKKKLQNSGYTYGYRQERYYTSQYLPSTGNSNSNVISHYKGSVDGTATAVLQSSTAGYSGAHLTKKLLLDTQHTPAEYLLSFTKIFGLYYLKNPWDNVIHIMTRDEFYRQEVVRDIDNDVDRGSPIKVLPEAFESKFYDFALKPTGGEWADRYEATYSRVFGSQRIDTGYEFESQPKDIFSGNTYTSCVCGTQKSKYYLAPLQFAPSNQMPAYVMQDFDYDLYHYSTGGSDYEVHNVDMGGVRTWNFEPLREDMYYDLFSKPQFRDAEGKAVKGENTLLFFDGMVDCHNVNGREIPYWITDDMRVMSELNDGKACWVYTESEYDADGNDVAIKRLRLPQFTRYIANSAGTITYSLDFGEPRQLYSQYLTTNPTSTIYSKYWRNYIEDMYNADTRVVTARIKIEQRPNPEFLRDFWWFDNSYWRLNKITDWNVSSFEPTECEFVKVHFPENYGDSSVSTVRLVSDTYNVAATGGTVEVTVETEGGWTFGGDWFAFSTSSPTEGTGNATLTVDIGANSGVEPRFVRLRATSTDDGTWSEITIRQAGA